MKLKIYSLLIVKFLLSSSIFASNPPLPPVNYPIQVTFDDDTGSLRLRWTDDPDQFLTSSRAPADPEKCRLLTHQHFHEIRMHMIARIKRQQELELSPLNDKLVVQKQVVTPYSPLPSVASIMQTISCQQLLEPLPLPEQPLMPAPQPPLQSLRITNYTPENPAPFRPAEQRVARRSSIRGLKRSSESVFCAMQVITFHDASEPS